MNSPEPVIRASEICKIYRIYQNPFDPLIEIFTSRPRHIPRNALHDINLELNQGEIVGILGRNGAGKSTLLKIIAGTLEASRGFLDVKGRITAILELGTGFHPEYTGRENIYMGGFCLGMSRKEIDSKIDKIIDFSELHDVIEQPFKTYSTGMQTRLTFSTAISVDPDILIIDEALSVGDAKFQMKCYAWMQKLREKNATVLIVSHDINTVTTLCDRAILLEDGAIYAEGEVKKITEIYHSLLFGDIKGFSLGSKILNEILTVKDNKFDLQNSGKVEHDYVMSSDKQSNQTQYKHVRYGNGDAQLESWGLFDADNVPVSVIESGNNFKFQMTFTCPQAIADLSCGFAIKDRRGTVLWGVTNLTDNQTNLSVSSGDIVTVVCQGTMWLASGKYFVTLGLADADTGNKIDFIEDAISFHVTGTDKIYTTSMVNLDTELKLSIENKKSWL